jgi:hypothetical protein
MVFPALQVGLGEGFAPSAATSMLACRTMCCLFPSI